MSYISTIPNYGGRQPNNTAYIKYFVTSNTSLGAKGVTGIGATGSIGVTGVQGSTGAQGIPGTAAAQGDTGVQGTTGATGVQGTTGATGVQGTTGATGVQGTTGATGVQGTTGATGVQGTTGATGVQGTTGATGVQGTTGATGVQGTTGATGVQGTTGATGATGAPGATGATGAPGATGATGAPGATGVQGTTGATGVQGTTGATGVQGATGVTGSQGFQGATGVTGSQGFQGATGVTGSQGFQGATGVTGSQGFQGATGVTGSQGATGVTGSQGFQGATGVTGSQGFQGATGVTGSQGFQGATGVTGSQGFQGATGEPGVALGNVATVDAVYGDDSTASVGGSPYRSVGTAVAGVTGGQTVWILPGTYGITGATGITLRAGTSLRGMSTQTTTLQMGVTGSATMITMGENCRIEDLTLNLNCTGTADNVTLKGIVFGGTTSQTSKLRTCVLTINNSTMSSALTSTVTGVEFSGTGSLTSSSFSFNSLKGSTINVYSNGGGNKRGILVSNSNQASIRDLNVYVTAPGSTGSTGSYVGIETNDPTNNTGSIQLRATTSGIVGPTGAQPYTASDILQTTPATITNPTYLASAGIQVGPGTDLVTKSAGDKGFTTYIYPQTLYYGLKGNVTTGASSGWLWLGTMAATNNVFPDPGTPPAYYRVQQPSLVSGISASLNSAPTSGNVTLTAQYTPISDQSPRPNGGVASFTGSIGGANSNTLSITSAVTGTIQIGQLLTGTSVGNRTYIISGSGTSWTVSNSLAVASTAMTATCYKAGATFTASITGGTQLNVLSAVVGTIQIGQYVSAADGGTSVANGTFIVSGSGTTWTLNQSTSTGSRAMLSYAIIPTAFQATFTSDITNSSFYNSSTRLNTGDKLHLLLTYSGAASAHDVTTQIDLF